MSELFETINAHSAEAKNGERVEVEAAQARRTKAAKAKRRKAHRSMLIRAIACIVAVAGLWVATCWELVAVQLTRPLVMAIFTYLAFWFGSWVQFSWCEGGLLE